MQYKTIFGRKPKKENKKEFCKRIVELLNNIEYISDRHIYSNGFYMINVYLNLNKVKDVNINDSYK